MMPPFGPTEICDVFKGVDVRMDGIYIRVGVCVCICIYKYIINIYIYLFAYFYINQKIGGTRYADFH